MLPNFRRYLQLAQSRGGACFCTRDAMQSYAIGPLLSRWQKLWHLKGATGGSRGGPWRQSQDVSLYLLNFRATERQLYVPHGILIVFEIRCEGGFYDITVNFENIYKFR